MTHDYFETIVHRLRKLRINVKIYKFAICGLEFSDLRFNDERTFYKFACPTLHLTIQENWNFKLF
jgi:hypothetical protein